LLVTLSRIDRVELILAFGQITTVAETVSSFGFSYVLSSFSLHSRVGVHAAPCVVDSASHPYLSAFFNDVVL